MKKGLFFLVLSIPLMNIGCEKFIPEPIFKCQPLPYSPAIGWTYIYPDTGYSAPCFNPENPNEIIYREHHFNAGEFWLCKLNLLTLQKEYIFQGKFWSYPKWGLNDWIIFTLSDANVYKIKSDGTQLSQITNNGKSFAPGWSYDYNKIHLSSSIIYEDTSRPGTFINRGIGLSIDLEGNILDTLWGGWGYRIAPFNDSLGAYIGDRGLSIYNFKSGKHQYIFSNDPIEAKGGTGIFRPDNNTLVWSRMAGLFTTDLNTQKTTGIAPTCNSDYYTNPTYAPQINKVIWEHVVKIPKGGFLDGKTEFIMMNPDGTGAKLIKIP